MTLPSDPKPQVKEPDTGARTEGKLLIVDDEPAVRRALHTTLFTLGFDIGEAASGEEALALCRIIKYDGILLDINMTGKSGIEICAELRRMQPRLAILMISVNEDEERKVQALEAGADDYVTKPFHMRELTARIRSALRRARTTAADSEGLIVIGNLTLNPDRRLVQMAGTTLHLTPKEFDLLHYLMTHPGLPITHSRLLRAVWGPEYISQVEYLRTFVRQLRKKLGDDATNPRYLRTDSHVGYRFADPNDWPKEEKTAL